MDETGNKPPFPDFVVFAIPRGDVSPTTMEHRSKSCYCTTDQIGKAINIHYDGTDRIGNTIMLRYDAADRVNNTIMSCYDATDRISNTIMLRYNTADRADKAIPPFMMLLT